MEQVDRNGSAQLKLRSQMKVIGLCPAQESLEDMAWEMTEAFYSQGRKREQLARSPEKKEKIRIMFQHFHSCDGCLQEYYLLLRDYAATTPSSQVDIPPSFLCRAGAAAAMTGFFIRSLSPVFRSDGGAIIYSSIIPVKNDYILLELSGNEGDMRLKIEKGVKNSGRIQISLYNNQALVESLFLQDRHSWRVGTLKPGSYSLKMEDQIPLQFKIEE